MIKPVVIFLTWLAIVSSEDTKKVADNVAISSDITTKVKRYFNHDLSLHKSPCPPFYPHLHEPKSPMHLTRPYGPPAYPKPIYGPPPMPIHHAEFIHQPIYASYQPKQTISYAKPQIPIAKPDYHYLPSKSPQIIHQAQPIHSVIHQQAQWQYQQPQLHHEKPHFAYAPIYHKPMIHHQQPISYMKPVNLHVHPTPGIVYKMETKKCEPCHQTKIEHPHPVQNHYPMPQIIHVKPIQPVYQHPQPVYQHPEPVYHPFTFHLPTSHDHIEPAIVKAVGHEAPCTKKW